MDGNKQEGGNSNYYNEEEVVVVEEDDDDEDKKSKKGGLPRWKGLKMLFGVAELVSERFAELRRQLRVVANRGTSAYLRAATMQGRELEATQPRGALTSGVSGSQRALGAAALLEVTSSGLTHACGEGGYFKYLCKPLLAIFSAHRLRHGAYLSSRNFGTVELRHPGAGGARGGSLLVQLHRIDGSVALSPTIFQAARPEGLILIVLISTLLLVAVRRRHHRKVARGPTVQTRQLGGGRQRRRKVE